jgi:predicted nuclease with TOPRIM domain
MSITTIDELNEYLRQERENTRKMTEQLKSMCKQLDEIGNGIASKNQRIIELEKENMELKNRLKKRGKKTDDFDFKGKLVELKAKHDIKNDAEFFVIISRLFLNSYDDPKWRTELEVKNE